MSNSVSCSYPKNNQDTSLREEIIKNPSLINAWSARLAEQVPFCPCPPETAKPALVAVDGGILTPNGNFLDLTDLSKSQIKMMAYSYASNAYPVNGSAMPDNLE